MYKYDQTVIES